MREKVAKKRAGCYNRYMRFTELKSSLSSDPPSFGYYLTGDDEYVRSRAVDIITGGAAFPEFNVTTLDEPSSGAVLDELNAMPVMSGRRYVVVRVLSEAEELSVKKARIYSRLLTDAALAEDIEALSMRLERRKVALFKLAGEKK